MNKTIIYGTNYPFAAGTYHGFIMSLQYNIDNIPGVEVTDQAKFEKYIERELQKLDKRIQEYSYQMATSAVS